MKKVFNLSVILAVLAAFTFSFTSCGDDDDDAAVISITFNQGGKFASGDAVVATISSPDEDLTSLELWNADTKSKIKNLETPKKDNENKYVLSITSLADGNYTLKAFSKSGAQEGDFTVGAGSGTTIDWSKGTNTITANGTYNYKQGDNTGVVVVTNLSTTNVNVALDGKAVVTLSDSGDSYLLKDGTSSSKDGATASNFLLAKKYGSASIVDNSGLTTVIQGATGVVFVVAQ